MLKDISQKAQELIAIKALFDSLCVHKSYTTILRSLNKTLALPPTDEISHKEQLELRKLKEIAESEAGKIVRCRKEEWVCVFCEEAALVNKQLLKAAVANILDVLITALALPVCVPKH